MNLANLSKINLKSHKVIHSLRAEKTNVDCKNKRRNRNILNFSKTDQKLNNKSINNQLSLRNPKSHSNLNKNKRNSFQNNKNQ